MSNRSDKIFDKAVRALITLAEEDGMDEAELKMHDCRKYKGYTVTITVTSPERNLKDNS